MPPRRLSPCAKQLCAIPTQAHHPAIPIRASTTHRPPSAHPIRHARAREPLGATGGLQRWRFQSAIPPTTAGEADTRAMEAPERRRGSPQVDAHVPQLQHSGLLRRVSLLEARMPTYCTDFAYLLSSSAFMRHSQKSQCSLSEAWPCVYPFGDAASVFTAASGTLDRSCNPATTCQCTVSYCLLRHN